MSRVKSVSGGIGREQGVAERAHSSDEARVFWVVAQFLAQRRNVDVDRTVEDLVIALPDFLEQLFARLDPANGS